MISKLHVHKLLEIKPLQNTPYGRLSRSNVQRPKPYLYSPQQIEQLPAEASLLKPKGSLRSHTYTTMIGLIAGTGLRVGEAIRLTVRDVHLKADPAYLEVLQTKFRKSRLVALHSTTADKLLGHENIQTTHGYIEADLLIKEQALQKLVPAGQPTARF